MDLMTRVSYYKATFQYRRHQSRERILVIYGSLDFLVHHLTKLRVPLAFKIIILTKTKIKLRFDINSQTKVKYFPSSYRLFIT